MDVISHPGQHLREYMDDYALSQRGLAQHLGVSVRTVHEIVHGQRGVSAEMSLRLGRLFGQSDLFWLKIQMDYDLQRARGRVDLSAITPLAG